MYSILRVFAILAFLMETNAAQYTMTPEDETIFKPCEGEEDHSLDTVFDLSKMTFNFVSDDEVIVDGYFTSIADIKPNDTLWVVLEVFKAVRGKYILPTIEIKRDDMCKSVFDPSEVWYSFVAKLDKKYQICPNVKGTVYGLSNWSSKDNHVTLPDSKLAGAYRSFIRIGVNGNEKLHMCVVVDFHFFFLSL